MSPEVIGEIHVALYLAISLPALVVIWDAPAGDEFSPAGLTVEGVLSQ
jgi:hypothetical protein